MVAGSVTSQWPDHQPADLLRQRLDALLQRVALIGEGKLGTLRMAGLGDAPGDRPVVGDPHDQAALAAHQSRAFRHDRPRCAAAIAGFLWHRGAGPHKRAALPPISRNAVWAGRPEYRRGQSVCPGDMVLWQGRRRVRAIEGETR